MDLFLHAGNDPFFSIENENFTVANLRLKKVLRNVYSL